MSEVHTCLPEQAARSAKARTVEASKKRATRLAVQDARSAKARAREASDK